MVRTRAQAGKQHEMRRSRERKAKKSVTNVSSGEASSGGGRKTSVSKDSTNVSLEEVDSSSRKKGAKQPLQSNMQRASRLFRASHSHFLRSSEEGRLLQEGHIVGISNLAISSVGRLSDSLQPTSIDRTQVLHDASSVFKDSSIKLDLFRVQQLSSLQASADKLDIPPAILDNTISLTNIKMPKRFHKYLEETVIASIGKTSSEQDTLEERRHSTFDSEIASSPSPRKPSDKRRRKERHENQQSFQVVFDNHSKQQTSTDRLPSQNADHTQNTTVSTPLAAEPFGRKHGRRVDEAEYENVLTNLSTFSPRKYSSRIGDDLSQQSISVTPQDVQPFGQRRKRIENENKHKFGDVLSQQSFRLSPRKSASRIGEVSQQSIPKSPQAEQPFGKRQKILQVEDNFEDILSQSSPRLPLMKSNSKIGEISHSSISESPQALQPFGERQKRLQNEHNFEDILSQSFPRTSPRKHNCKTGKASHSSISKSPQAVQPHVKSQKALENNSLENIVDQSSYRLTQRKSNSKPDEVSHSSISESPQPIKLFHKRQKRLQNDNFEDMLAQSSPRLSQRKSNSTADEFSQNSISESSPTLQLFHKGQKKLQNNNFEDMLAQSSPRLSQRKSNSKADEFSQNSVSESPQTLQLFHKGQKRLQNANFEDMLAQSSPRLSQRKSNSKADEFSQNSVSESPQTVQPLSKRQKGLQNADKFGEIFNQPSPGLSTRKHSTQAVQSFDKRQKREQTEDSIKDALHQSPVRFSPNKSTFRTEEASQQSIFGTPQVTQPFGKREKKTQNGVNFQDILSELSPKSSPRKSNSKTGEVSWKNITELPPSAQLFNDLQKTMQRKDNFEDIVSQSPPRRSPRKLGSKTGEVSQSSFSKSPQAVQPFGKKQKRLRNKDNYEVAASQSFRRTSPRKLNSKTGDISQSSISVTPQTVQPFGKRQKIIQNEDSFEAVLNGSSPRASNSKTGGLPLNSISESSPTAQSFTQTQKRIQNEDKIQDNLRHSSPRLSPRKSSSRTKNVLQDNISESAPDLKQYDNTQKRTQNEDSFEDTASQPSPRLSPRKSTTTGEVSQNSFSESLPAIQPFGKRLMGVQNKNNFEDVLSQSSPRLSPRKTSSKLREISESPQIVNSFVYRESRTKENAAHENMVDTSSPKEIKSKSAPEYTAKTNDVSLVAASAETLKDVSLPDKRQSLNKVKNALEHSSLKMSSRKYAFRSFIETNKESFENENQESNRDQSSRIGLSSKTAQHITAQKNDAQNSIFEAPKSMQTFGLRKMYSNEDNFSSDLEHSSPKVISRDDKMSMKRSFSVISADSSRRANTAKSQIKRVVEQRAATENLIVGDPELHADSFHENRSEVSSQTRQSHSLTAEMIREGSKKLSEESPTKQRQKHNDLNVLAHEEAFQAGSMSSQEFTGGSVSSEQHGHKLSANRKLAISLRDSIMRNQSQLSSSERVEHDTLTKDNSIQNPKNIIDQMVLAEKYLIPSQELNSPSTKLHHLSKQEDAGENLQGLPKLTSAFEETAYAMGEHAREAGTIKPFEPQTNNSELGSQKCNATHSEVQRTETIEMLRKDGFQQPSKNPELLTASRVIQDASWGPLDSARMDSSTSSLKSNTDDSFYLRLKTKRKRYRKLSQLNKFDGGTSDSSNVSKYASVQKPAFVRKRKRSLNARNGLVPTKHIANTESRAVVHKMVAPVILTDAESQVQNVTGLIVADSNMTECINTEDILHTRIDNEHRKEREYQQSSTKKLNYTGLDSNVCKPVSEAKGPELSKSWLQRRGHGQKKQINVENHSKQLKMPLYHRQWTRENESYRLHLVLKSIAKGNVHQDKKLEDKTVVQPTSISTKAKEEIVIKKNRKTNPALMVNGKIYRAPRLARPKQWVNKHLYDYLMPSITAKYGEANSRTMAEEYVTYLCHQVSTVVRRKNYNSYRINLEKIKKSLYNLGLIKCYNDYFVFIEKYLPFEFRYKAVPCIRAFGKHTGPPWSKDINIFADLGY